MTSTRATTTPSSPARDRAAQHRWGVAHYLALIGAPILFVQIWTTIAWLPDAHQVTQFKTPYSVDWWAARFFEVLGIVAFVVVTVIVTRQCLRQRRLTFDAILLLCGMTAWWSDHGINVFGPVMLYSSNWVNVTTPLGHAPGMVDPDIGRLPDPVLFTIPLESAGAVLGAWLICWIAGRIRQRRPDTSTAKLLLILFGVGLALDLALEVPFVALGLWTYTAPSWMSLNFASGLRFPVAEWLGGGFWFLCFGMLRLFKNDRGETLVERGLDYLPRWRRTAITMLATYFCVQFVNWGPSAWVDVAYLPYEQPWPHVPSYLLTDACNAPGVSGTRYGPCPGSPDFRLPGRTSHLPEPKP